MINRMDMDILAINSIQTLNGPLCVGSQLFFSSGLRFNVLVNEFQQMKHFTSKLFIVDILFDDIIDGFPIGEFSEKCPSQPFGTFYVVYL